MLKDRNDISKFCILPAEHNWPSQFPRHRWQQVLTKWKPTSAPICHCCFEATGDAQTRHVQYRVYSSGLKIECETCAQPNEQGNKGQSKHFYSNFVGNFLTSEKIVYVSSSCVEESCDSSVPKPSKGQTTDRISDLRGGGTASSSKGKISRKSSNLRDDARDSSRSRTRQFITNDCGPPPDSIAFTEGNPASPNGRTGLHSNFSTGTERNSASPNGRTKLHSATGDSPLNSLTENPASPNGRTGDSHSNSTLDNTHDDPRTLADHHAGSFVASTDKTLVQIYEANWSPSEAYPAESRERQKKKEK